MTKNIQSRSKLDHQECLLMDILAVQPNFLLRTATNGLCKGLVYYPVMREYVCGGGRVKATTASARRDCENFTLNLPQVTLPSA